MHAKYVKTHSIMLDRLMKSALVFTAGAAVGVAGALWLMSDSGKEVRDELQDLAKQAKDKLQECKEQIKQEMEDKDGKREE